MEQLIQKICEWWTDWRQDRKELRERRAALKRVVPRPLRLYLEDLRRLQQHGPLRYELESRQHRGEHRVVHGPSDIWLRNNSFRTMRLSRYWDADYGEEKPTQDLLVLFADHQPTWSIEFYYEQSRWKIEEIEIWDEKHPSLKRKMRMTDLPTEDVEAVREIRQQILHAERDADAQQAA